jgi:hypothetical protein
MVFLVGGGRGVGGGGPLCPDTRLYTHRDRPWSLSSHPTSVIGGARSTVIYIDTVVSTLKLSLDDRSAVTYSNTYPESNVRKK